MAIGFVKHVGSATDSATTSVVTIPAGGVAAGNKVIVRAYRSSSGITVTGIADSGGNSYVKLDSLNAGAGANSTEHWIGTITTALTSGQTITTTFSSMGGNGSAVDEFSNLLITTDDTDNAAGSGTTPTETITPANPTNLIVATLSVTAGSADGFTEDTDSDGGDTWHSLTSVAGISFFMLRGAYKITTSAVTQTYNPVLGTSRGWIELLTGLQGSEVAATFRAKLHKPVLQAVNRGAVI